MSFSPAQPAPAPVPGGSGYTFGLRQTKAALTATLHISAAAQDRDFGRRLAPGFVAVGVGRGQDEGRLLLTPATEGVLAKPAMKGSVCLRLKPWDLLPKEPKKSEACKVAGKTDCGVIIILPRWADGKDALRVAPKVA